MYVHEVVKLIASILNTLKVKKKRMNYLSCYNTVICILIPCAIRIYVDAVADTDAMIDSIWMDSIVDKLARNDMHCQLFVTCLAAACLLHHT